MEPALSFPLSLPPSLGDGQALVTVPQSFWIMGMKKQSNLSTKKSSWNLQHMNWVGVGEEQILRETNHHIEKSWKLTHISAENLGRSPESILAEDSQF